jgi:phenolic acid decarboxylase
MHWDSHQRKQNFIDKFINDKIMSHLSPDGKSVVVIVTMDAVAFSWTRKHNAPVSKKKLIKALSAQPIVIMVNKFNTSPKCHNCYSNDLKDVMRDRKKVYVLRQCV